MGKYHGKGILYNEANGIKYIEGDFAEGLPYGNCVIYDRTSGVKRYEGGVLKGELNGEGSIYDENGVLIRTGTFLNGKFLYPD